MRFPVIFLDDGGVMNENARRGPQWQALVARFLAPRLGGSVEAWRHANRVVAERVWHGYLEAVRENPALDAGLYRETEHLLWLRGMCAEVGVDAPDDRQACIQLAEETNAYVTRRVRAAYPGVVEAIRRLHTAGYALHTASGEHSADLDGYLEGMGVRECFGTLYGPDLVRSVKSGPRYYAAILDHAKVDPRDALFVDDGEAVLDAAASLGALTVLCAADPPSDRRHRHVRALAGLPDLVIGG